MNNKTIEKAVRATIEAGNTNGQFFEGIREEVQAELEAQIDKRRDDGKKHDDAYIDSNPIMEDINIHFSLSYAPDDVKAEEAAKGKAVRCPKCKWVHEADSVAGTSFRGVELCPEHSAAADKYAADDLRTVSDHMDELANYLAETHEENMRHGEGMSMEEHQADEPNCSYCRAIAKALNLSKEVAKKLKGAK